jgi:serine O-acetyltransferase
MDIYTRLVYLRNKPLVGKWAYYALKFMGVEFPCSVQVGKGLLLEHGGFGTVIHSHTSIGDRVKIYPGVTVGRADIYLPAHQSAFKGVVIEDDVILSPGSRVLGKDGILYVRRGTVIGANAVLLQSTGEWEIWVGMPAHCAGKRDRPPLTSTVGHESE